MYPRVKGVLDKLSMSVEEFVNWLLEEHGVAILPGTAFSESTMGREYVRLSFALDEKLIIEGLRRVKEAIEGLKPR
jgi:Aspartate/tyrosine/aromatic aminotransferase